MGAWCSWASGAAPHLHLCVAQGRGGAFRLPLLAGTCLARGTPARLSPGAEFVHRLLRAGSAAGPLCGYLDVRARDAAAEAVCELCLVRAVGCA